MKDMKEIIAFIRFLIALPILIPILLLFELFLLIGGDNAKKVMIKTLERLEDSYE